MAKEVVITLICNFIGVFNLVWIYSIINNNKFKPKMRQVILIFICSCINSLFFYLDIIPLKTISSFVLLIVLNKLIYKDSWNSTIIYCFIIWILGMIFDLVFVSIFSYIGSNYINIINNKYEYYIMCASTIILQILYNLFVRIKIVKVSLKKFHDLFKKINYKYVLFLLLIISICVIGAIAVNNISNSPFVIYLLTLALLLTTIFVLFYSRKYQIYNLSNTINILLENNKFYSNLNLDFREFKHNLVHKLDGLKLYSNEKSILLIDNIISDCCNLTKNTKELDKLPIGLSGYIYQKIYQYDYSALNILIDNNIKSDLFNVLSPRNYNKLCEVLGVLLDNAIQASIDSKSKILYISSEENDKNLEINIKNSFSSQIDMEKLGNVNYTTKGQNHGIGLFSIFKNKDVKTNIKINNDIFESIVLVKKEIK